jgi:hypothetical protein
MSPLRVLVLVLMIASLVCSAWVLTRMLREISEAEGKKGKISLFSLFAGGPYLLHRYSESVPDGRTAAWFLLLIPTNVMLIGLYLVLGRHQS